MKLCTWSTAKIVKSMHTLESSPKTGEKAEMAIAKRVRAVFHHHLGHHVKVVHWGESLKLVSCFRDKRALMRCRQQVDSRTILACLALPKKSTRRNPRGLMWRGPFHTSHASKQRYCCQSSAKQCGDAWMYSLKAIESRTQSEPELDISFKEKVP